MGRYYIPDEETASKTMLVIRLSAMGDVAMTVPVLHSLMRKYPDMNVVVLTTYGYDPMFDDIPGLVVKHFDRHGGDKGLWGIVKVFLRLRKFYKFDYIADLHNVLRSRLLSFLFRVTSHPKIAHIDKGRAQKHELVKRGALAYGKCLDSSFVRYQRVFESLGFRFPLQFHSMFDKHERPFNSEFLAAIGGAKRPEEKWVGIAAFAGHKGKIYPLRMMGKVVDLLGKHSNYRIFLFGHGKGEKAVMSQWAKRNGDNVYMMPPHTYLPDELQLMRHLDVMVSMDSANMHLASLTATRVISIWGATHYYAGFLGWQQSPDDVVDVPLACRPCSVFGNKHCTKTEGRAYECLFSIAPETIAARVEAAVE